jgi:hypothetical protein
MVLTQVLPVKGHHFGEVWFCCKSGKPIQTKQKPPPDKSIVEKAFGGSLVSFGRSIVEKNAFKISIVAFYRQSIKRVVNPRVLTRTYKPPISFNRTPFESTY